MKQKIVDMARQATRALSWEEMGWFTASGISGRLGASRNVVSQYLNELAEAGVLIKIKSRPVYFMHRSQLEQDWDTQLSNRSFKSVAELREALQSPGNVQAVQLEELGFDGLIGADGSLSYCLEQCKSAVAYPGGGLPLLLYGPTGTGKSMLAHMMYQYGAAKGVLAPGAPFVTLNCSEYANNPELVTANLFGHVKGAYTGAVKDNKGLLATSDGGMLFLDEVHCLRAECQEKLFLFMDKGIYHLMGDNDHWHTSDVRLVFATTENPEEALLRTFLRRIPIVANLPALDERSRIEKHKLICFLLREEMARTNHRIYISNAVYSLLMEYTFKGNIGDLKNCIKACCANAFLSGGLGDGRLEVTVSNLPGYIMRFMTSGWPGGEDNKLCSIEELTTGTEVNRTMSFSHRLVTLFRISTKKKEPIDEMLRLLQGAVTEYLETKAYESQATRNPKQQLFTATFESIAETVVNKYVLAPRSELMASFAIHLYDLYCNSAAYKRLEDKEQADVKLMGQTLSAKLPRQYGIAREMMELFQTQLGLEMGALAAILLALIINTGRREAGFSRCMCVIVCHGRSTASSMAAAANAHLGSYVFDAVDIPPGTADEVLPRLKERLGTMQGFERLVVLADMDPLESIRSGLDYLESVDIGIINNASTRLAIHVGEELIREQDMNTMLQNAADACGFDHKVLYNRRKRDAVLTVCATGIGAAYKICELFMDSLPEKLALEVIPCDYESLRVDGQKAPAFSKYNVQFIIGTLDPQVEEVPFISLDDLSTSHDTGVAAQLLSPYLNYQEMRQFEKNILKSFSLQNLLNYLNILNADKVLGFVDRAVERLQEALGIRLQGSTVAGLHLHIGCLLEKLIMQEETLELPDSDRFFDTNEEFVRLVKNSFSELEKHYSVEIPLGEIKYINEYVRADRR